MASMTPALDKILGTPAAAQFIGHVNSWLAWCNDPGMRQTLSETLASAWLWGWAAKEAATPPTPAAPAIPLAPPPDSTSTGPVAIAPASPATK